ncbi:MAG: hypothetical protein HC842_09455, partial [Cytophagales bacterium]|nr:hypothetical protein [Cytophagales bacterium]
PTAQLYFDATRPCIAPSSTVRDGKGAKSSTSITLHVGNGASQISLHTSANQTFFFGKQLIPYEIKVADPEDGSTETGGIAPSEVSVKFDFVPVGLDRAEAQGTLLLHPGQALAESSDCSSCHHREKESVGPSYEQIALRYPLESSTVHQLGKKIITGGNGNWGHRLMAAHPQHSLEETKQMVEYILRLHPKRQKSSLLLKGSLAMDQHQDQGQGAHYFLEVSYTDRTAHGITGQHTVRNWHWRHPKVEAETYEKGKGVSRERPQGGDFAFVRGFVPGAYAVYPQIDLTGIETIVLQKKASQQNLRVVIRGDSSTGTVLAEGFVSEIDKEKTSSPMTLSVKGKGIHDLFLMVEKPDASGELLRVDWLEFIPDLR